ncbi:MAG: hypothetical protein C0481_03885 [Phenylobacterium sp.]|uniref:glycosyltransferase family 87 protein n=1 Tax=Phenylobacterium sp. TaxID=1871053 RepID=UPI0025F2D433|nr:glycosyltransferase family 87 protein [Phenylobacterium sp.]MBA4010984.1 hypothetical protein [Phenylobacterium sp.]
MRVEVLEQLAPWLTRRLVLMGALAYFLASLVGFVVAKLFFPDAVVIFGSFWESGRAASAGLDPYLNYPLVFTPKFPSFVHEVNMNPPAALPLFQVFALLPVTFAAALWVVIFGALHLACVFALDRRLDLSRVQLVWLITVFGLGGIGMGQIYTLLLALGLGIWLSLQSDRLTLAGVLLGILVAIKPNFALCGMVLFASGHFRPVMIAALVAIALSALPVLLYGPQVYDQWLAAIARDNHGTVFAHEVSLSGFLRRAGLGMIALPVALSACLAGLAYAWRAKPSSLDALAFGIWLSIICAPLAWGIYLVVITPALVTRRWDWTMILCVALLSLSIDLSIWAIRHPAFVTLVGALYMAPIMLVGWAIVRRIGMASSAGGSPSGPTLQPAYKKSGSA